jgi:predicted RNA binding protein YcfA (HicA-like mRNA interferase family)
LIAALRAAGFDGPFQGGKHEYMERGALKVSIPNPHKGDIGVGFLVRIIAQAGITKDDWGKL